MTSDNSRGRTVRVVAVQLASELAADAIPRNLAHIEDIVGQAAREHHPDAIFLPEAAAIPNVAHRIMRHTTVPIDGPPLQTLRRLAREHGCVVGGGYVAVRGRDARGTYCLAEPDGSVRFHDKDQASIWENNYYKGPSGPPGTADDGIVESSLGTIGIANGFEWMRSRTAARLRGRVGLLAGGMCFPSYPTWALTRPYFWRREHRIMLEWSLESPGRMARAIGAPCVQPAHVGEVVMETPIPGLAGVDWPTILVGETQITDAAGTILARLAYQDGEGYVCADVALGPVAPLTPVPEHFWMATPPVSTQAVWHLGNRIGRAKYEAMKLLRMHRWKAGGDLPNHCPAELLPPLGPTVVAPAAEPAGAA